MADILGERDDNVPDRPSRVSEPSRQSQLPKRFYKDVQVDAEGVGFVVKLDGKPIRTPGKDLLTTSSKSVADLMAQEWSSQEQRIDPMTMPVTRLLNTAIDGVATDMQAVKEDILRFSSSDMLCYRTEGPEALNELHLQYWDPLIEWAQVSLGAQFSLAQGVMYIEQPGEAIAAFSAHLGPIGDPLLLAACHLVTSLTGSAIIAMAVLKNECDLDEAWQIAHVDEDWNASQWGEDVEATQRRAARLVDMTAAVACIEALR